MVEEYCLGLKEFILYMFFVREVQSHGDTLKLNERACLQWNLGKPPGGGGTPSGWKPNRKWLAAKRQWDSRGKWWWL